MEIPKVGLYIRLSKEDKKGKSESESIANQRALLSDYVKERGWNIEKIYIDDGYSGMTYNRPEVKRLIDDVKRDRINTVVTKDMSRLGRDLAETLQLLRKFFPRQQVRYISVLDRIDTTTGTDMRISVNGFLNEQYAMDISMKSKEAKKAKAKQGKFVNSIPPYGYKKDPADKNHLIIDECASSIVRRIFNMYANGYSARAIADTLNSEKILPPREYHYQQENKVNPFHKDSGVWGGRTITAMLSKEVYLGHMIQGVRKTISPLLKERVTMPKDEWIRVTNTHEPIVDKILWDRVQAISADNDKHGRVGRSVNKNGQVSLFKGKVICGDCGKRMNHTTVRSGRNVYFKYRCSTYANAGNKACSYNAISEDDLHDIVLNDIHSVTKLLVTDEAALLEKISKLSNNIREDSKQEINRQIRKLKNDITNCERACRKLIDDRLNGLISDDMLKRMMAGYEEELKSKESELLILNNRFHEAQDLEEHTKTLLEGFKRYIYLEKLNREAITELIDKIVVHKPISRDNRQTRHVEIYYNFVGPIN
ncbi:MAG: recombinase family protein [Burkholderiales bacterium]